MCANLCFAAFCLTIMVIICELLDGGIGFHYPLLLFCGGVHGGVVVLDRTDYIKALVMVAQTL